MRPLQDVLDLRESHLAGLALCWSCSVCSTEKPLDRQKVHCSE